MKNTVIILFLLIVFIGTHKTSSECVRIDSMQQSSIKNKNTTHQNSADDIDETFIHTPAQFIVSSII